MTTFSVTPGVPGEPSVADLSAGSQQGGEAGACGTVLAGGAAQLEVAASGVDALDRASASDPGTTGSRQPEQEELHPSPAPTPHHSPPLEPRAESPRPPATTDSARGGSLEGSGSAFDPGQWASQHTSRDVVGARGSAYDPRADYIRTLEQRIEVLERKIAERNDTIRYLRALPGGEG